MSNYTAEQLRRTKGLRAAMDTAGGLLTDEQAQAIPDLYRVWAVGEAVAAGDIRRYEDALYRCVQAHTTQANWTPDATASLWTRIGNPADEWPEWIQPTGGHNAYAKGAKVSHKGKRWTSTADANVWEPGVYGWMEQA